ncbi:hypothetical protein L5515_007172 [Caenorhabditis briggsae]|uniref:Serpentine Receptor, class H n=1 Tax=Caenorhabditis briggsae TaxID=6238 RepID=A0AAE9F2E5_CAEBR|nr:hypothetical protein L5515_007172 [Caenorhabditis briggsae]
MEAVNVHRFEKSILQRLVYLIRYGFFVSIVVVLVITALIYPDLKYQKEYKTKMEQRFGQFQSYMCGFLLDFVMGVLWKVTVVLPVPIMCSNTFASEYAPNVFQLLPACFAYTGTSAISLFVYRMEAVIVHRSEQSLVRKFVKITKYAFYVSIVFVLIFTVLIYPDLKNQKPYKMKMEARFGAFKPYMWCDNCFFCNFDSKIFFAFFYVAGCAVILGGLTGGIAFYVTLRALKSVSSRLTAKTRATHRNYLLSLTLAAAVHVLCIIIPLAGFLSAINVLISLSEFRYFPFLLALVIQEHGAASTVIMFLTNNLLRKALKKLFWCEEILPTMENSSQRRSTIVA